eukprot:13624567-Alexandrium_andersonii.AAC.1
MKGVTPAPMSRSPIKKVASKPGERQLRNPGCCADPEPAWRESLAPTAPKKDDGGRPAAGG